jgi:hypothetical protein
MKFIDSLVANTTTSLQRDVGDGKESSSDLGVAGLPKRTLRKQSPGRIICARKRASLPRVKERLNRMPGLASAEVAKAYVAAVEGSHQGRILDPHEFAK